MWLFLLLLVVPIIEIALFIQVGGFIGLFPTLAIVILTAIAGTILLRSQGTSTLTELQQSVSSGKNPLTLIAHGAMILAAGIFLMTPGFFTDAVGLSLLVPPVRVAIMKWLSTRVSMQGSVHMSSGSRTDTEPRSGSVIDGEYSVASGTDLHDTDPVEDDSALKPGKSSQWTQPPE